MSINNFAILGERCSGTNFLEESIINNFNLSYTSEYGNKHFFCYNNYMNSDNTLFIGIIRNPIYWINSFSRELHHVPEINRKNLNNFLFNEFYSVEDKINIENANMYNENIIFNNKLYTHKYKVNLKDLNYITGKKYKNIFELRKVKNNFLLHVMPKKVKNYILINYEELLFNYKNVLENIKERFNLQQMQNDFIENKKYKKSNTYNFVQQRKILLSPSTVLTIWENLDKEQENLLGYKMWDDNNYFKKNDSDRAIDITHRVKTI
jgi:hypothetical protein